MSDVRDNRFALPDPVPTEDANYTRLQDQYRFGSKHPVAPVMEAPASLEVIPLPARL